MTRTTTWFHSALCRILLASIAILGLAANASATTLTFGELPFQPVDNLSFMGVTFDFKIGGLDSLDANYASGGPGTIVFVQDPSLEGNSNGVLRMDFATPTPTLQFGVALSDGQVRTPGYTVDLFDAALVPIGTFPVNTAPLPTFTEGQFNYAGVPVGRAVVSFNVPNARFAFDNMTYVPEPSTLALLGLGGIGIIVHGWRRRARAGR